FIGAVITGTLLGKHAHHSGVQRPITAPGLLLTYVTLDVAPSGDFSPDNIYSTSCHVMPRECWNVFTGCHNEINKARPLLRDVTHVWRSPGSWQVRAIGRRSSWLLKQSRREHVNEWIDARETFNSHPLGMPHSDGRGYGTNMDFLLGGTQNKPCV
ncbi:hypothetical protein BaRGS_00009163, partial [Batillaria attramentaria]